MVSLARDLSSIVRELVRSAEGLHCISLRRLGFAEDETLSRGTSTQTHAVLLHVEKQPISHATA
jgi:hypothetical protein